MSMNLPATPPEYSWRVETYLHTEKLARNEARVTLVAHKPRRLTFRRERPVATSKVITFKSGSKRDQKIERAATKLWRREQQHIFEQNQLAYAAHMANEDMRRALLQR